MHASTEYKNDKDKFPSICQALPKYDAVILTGDMNAKPGEDFLTPYTGKYRFYRISKYNIEKLCDFATAENLSLLVPCSHLKIFC